MKNALIPVFNGVYWYNSKFFTHPRTSAKGSESTIENLEDKSHCAVVRAVSGQRRDDDDYTVPLAVSGAGFARAWRAGDWAVGWNDFCC